MLTTTIDGLWILQVLTGIESVAPELGLRPHLPSVETPKMALAHPIADELIEVGAVDKTGAVDPAIREWLEVLSRRDVSLLVCAQLPGDADPGMRAVLARFARWWVVLERCGVVVRLSAAGTADTEDSARILIGDRIDRLLGEGRPAPMRPATLDRGAMLTAVSDDVALRHFLVRQRLESDQIDLLCEAADPARSRHTSVVAIQSGVAGGPCRSHIDPGAVTVIDAPSGRLLAEHLMTNGSAWVIVGPGTPAAIGAATQKMMRRLPVEGDWHSYRKAV